jgi:type VI secretion system secreted protein VgrG
MSQPSVQQVQTLSRRIDDLERRLAMYQASNDGIQGLLVIKAADEVEIVCGAASLTLKKDGTVMIRGNDCDISATRNTAIKTGGNLTLKGSKIVEN